MKKCHEKERAGFPTNNNPTEPMQVYRTRVNRASEAYRTNHADMTAQVARLREHLAQSQEQGTASTLKRWADEGRLVARERLELLLDPDTPFVEVCPLAGLGQSDYNVGGTTVGGVGVVCGVVCVISASVGTVRGGTVSPPTLQRAQRLDQIALENKLPMLRLNESGGGSSASCFVFVFFPHTRVQPSVSGSARASRSVPLGRRHVSRAGAAEQSRDPANIHRVWCGDSGRCVRTRLERLYHHGTPPRPHVLGRAAAG